MVPGPGVCRGTDIPLAVALGGLQAIEVACLVKGENERRSGGLIVRFGLGIKFIVRLQFEVMHRQAQIGELGTGGGIDVTGLQTL